MAKVISKMSVQITGNARGLTRAYDRAGKATKAFGRVTNRINTSLRRIGSSAVAAGAGLASFLGVASGFRFLGSALEKAGNMEETLDLMGRVFGENTDKAKEFSATMGKEMGRSRLQMIKFTTDAGAFLGALGFEDDELVKKSADMAARAVEMASAFDGVDTEMFERLRAALSGSGEVMLRFGIIINETTVKAELLAMGLKKATATPMQIAQARWNLLMRGSQTAMDNAADTIGSYTNQIKVLQAELENLKVSVGTALLPSVTKLVKKLILVAKWVQTNGKALARTTVQVLAFAAGWTAAVVVIPKVVAGIRGLILAIRSLTIAMTAAQAATGWGLVKVAVGLLAATGAALYAGKMFDDLLEDFDNTQTAAAKTAKAVDKVGQSVKKAGDAAKKANAVVTVGNVAGGVGAVTAGTMAGFSAVQSGKKQLIEMLKLMQEARRERRKQTTKLDEISSNTENQLVIQTAVI